MHSMQLFLTTFWVQYGLVWISMGVYAHKSPELEIADCWLHITPRTCSHCLPMAIRRYLTNPKPIIPPVKSHQSYHNETEFREFGLGIETKGTVYGRAVNFLEAGFFLTWMNALNLDIQDLQGLTRLPYDFHQFSQYFHRNSFSTWLPNDSLASKRRRSFFRGHLRPPACHHRWTFAKTITKEMNCWPQRASTASQQPLNSLWTLSLCVANASMQSLLDVDRKSADDCSKCSNLKFTR